MAALCAGRLILADEYSRRLAWLPLDGGRVSRRDARGSTWWRPGAAGLARDGPLRRLRGRARARPLQDALPRQAAAACPHVVIHARERRGERRDDAARRACRGRCSAARSRLRPRPAARCRGCASAGSWLRHPHARDRASPARSISAPGSASTRPQPARHRRRTGSSFDAASAPSSPPAASWRSAPGPGSPTTS